MEATVTARFNGYCNKCQHTFWRGETVEKTKEGFTHLDCLRALADRSPRKLSPKWEREFGLVKGIPSKAILKKKAKKRILKNSRPEGGPAQAPGN